MTDPDRPARRPIGIRLEVNPGASTPSISTLDEHEKSPQAGQPMPLEPLSPTHTLRLRGADGFVRQYNARIAAWASHRTVLVAAIWSSTENIEAGDLDWADVIEAVELSTGEVLDRSGLWRAVRGNKREAVPWYIAWADQRPIVAALAGFARAAFGQFRTAHFGPINEALQSIGMAPVDDAGMREIARRVDAPLRTMLDIERAACRIAALKLCINRDGAVRDEALRRFPLQGPKPASPPPASRH